MAGENQGQTQLHLDAVVVGAGFSGIASLYRFRKAGFKVKAFEAGSYFGGVWYWNRYPGARVDSEFPLYQLNIPEIHGTFKYKYKYPSQDELSGYFAHLDNVLNLSKDVYFNTEVTSAEYDSTIDRWILSAGNYVVTCKYLALASGALHRTNKPSFPGLENYGGKVYHTAAWPEELDVKGKRVAVIGAGATGVQVVQELAKKVDHLTVCIRTPSYCLPLGQKELSSEEQDEQSRTIQELLQKCRDTVAGYYPQKATEGSVFDRTSEEREALWESLWALGGFNFLQVNYSDMLIDPKANREVYNFWTKKTRPRLTDPVKRDIVAPLNPPYPFGTRRTPLDRDYYECLDQPNVDLVDLRATPIVEFTNTGMTTAVGRKCEFDVLILATGFDSFTGSLTTMNLKTKDGVHIRDLWKCGVQTYLGVFVHGLPNAFLLYSPQAPTALANGPTLIECQADLMMEAIQKLEAMNGRAIEARAEAQTEWSELCEKMVEGTLFPLAGSWWTGANVPGKKTQMFNFIGGLNNYEQICRDAVKSSKGFDFTTGKSSQSTLQHEKLGAVASISDPVAA